MKSRRRRRRDRLFTWKTQPTTRANSIAAVERVRAPQYRVAEAVSLLANARHAPVDRRTTLALASPIRKTPSTPARTAQWLETVRLKTATPFAHRIARWQQRCQTIANIETSTTINNDAKTANRKANTKHKSHMALKNESKYEHEPALSTRSDTLRQRDRQANQKRNPISTPYSRHHSSYTKLKNIDLFNHWRKGKDSTFSSFPEWQAAWGTKK